MFTDFKIKRKIKQIRKVVAICERFDIKTPVRDGVPDELEAALAKKDYRTVLDLYEELGKAVEGEK